MNRKILKLAIPNIISNITVPLLGMVDMTIAGHLTSAAYIGAIALGSTIFNLIYWNFSFLRMGTSGFTAQAYGANDMEESMTLLLRALSIGLIGGLVILIFQNPIGSIAIKAMSGSDEIKEYVHLYFKICVWSAPAMLMQYAFMGWFIGMQNAKIPMAIAIITNILNISISASLVFIAHMNIEGIALGTVIAQFSGTILSALIWWIKYKDIKQYARWDRVFEKNRIKKFFKVNFDIFFRTLLLVFVTTFFTFASTRMGDDLLAVNALIMQLFTLFSYFMDGFAYAGEALSGRYIGAGDQQSMRLMLKKLFSWGIYISFSVSILYAFFAQDILFILTDKTQIVELAQNYTAWTVAIPIVSFAAFLWDGIYIGATESKNMRNSMIVAVLCFFGVYYSFIGILENNALWLAFIIYLGIRGIMQTILSKKIPLVQHVFEVPKDSKRTV